ncbi:MAG: hypothetical protein V2A71_06320 [Candidatus Eisenbacteria bacterium]
MSAPKPRKCRQSGRSGNGILLDEKRLRAIKQRITDGYYNRSEVRRDIARRLVDRLLEEDEDGS